MGQYYMSQFEYILFFRKGKGVKINNCGTSDILSIPNKKTKDENGKNLHDTEKPIELMQILVENSSKENDIKLFELIETLNKKGIMWGLSNVFYNRGKENTYLIEWCNKNNWNVYHLNRNYNPFSKGNSNNDEVYICNYKE